MSNHTPTPWKLETDGFTAVGPRYSIQKQDGTQIAILRHKENAEFIITACNEYDDLVHGRRARNFTIKTQRETIDALATALEACVKKLNELANEKAPGSAYVQAVQGEQALALAKGGAA